MGLGRSVGPLKDQGLSGVKGAEISGSAGFFAEIDGEDGSSVGESWRALSSTDRPRASQIDAFAADLVHQRRPLSVRPCAVWHRVNKAPGLGEYIRIDRRQAGDLSPAIGQVP